MDRTMFMAFAMDEDENIEFLSLATKPNKIQSWIPVNFISEEEEIDTGKIYAPYKYYYLKSRPLYIELQQSQKEAKIPHNSENAFSPK